MFVKFFIMIALVVGPTRGLFGNRKTTTHQGASQEEENMQTGGTGGTFKFGVQKKPLFNTKLPKQNFVFGGSSKPLGLGGSTKPVGLGGSTKPLGSAPASGNEQMGVTEVKMDDMAKASELAKMSITEVLQKFPNREFTFRRQAKKHTKDANPNAMPFLKINKVQRMGVAAKAPTPVEFPVPGVCKPIDYCEDLATLSKIKDGFIWPASITYPRCGGCCLPHQESVAVKKKTRKVHIVVISFIDSTSTLDEHTYDEHEECECVCKVKKEQCNKLTEDYDPDNCRCMCKPDAKDKVTCGPRQQWSDTHCGCVCKYPDTQCPSYQNFDDQTCLCV